MKIGDVSYAAVRGKTVFYDLVLRPRFSREGIVWDTKKDACSATNKVTAAYIAHIKKIVISIRNAPKVDPE